MGNDASPPKTYTPAQRVRAVAEALCKLQADYDRDDLGWQALDDLLQARKTSGGVLPSKIASFAAALEKAADQLDGTAERIYQWQATCLRCKGVRDCSYAPALAHLCAICEHDAWRAAMAEVMANYKVPHVFDV